LGQEQVVVFGMNWTEIILFLSVLVTLSLGIYNAVNARLLFNKTKYIDTITAERIKWLEKLRADISRFSGLTSFWIKTLRNNNNQDSHEVLKEIDVLRVMIKLRLNPNGNYDKEIIGLLDIIPTLTDRSDITEINIALDKLTIASQKLLKEEWNRVKKESEKGIEVPI